MQDLQRGRRLEKLFVECPQSRDETFRIGDLAREFDITLRTLRFYEDRGLIQPRREGSTRLYCEEDRARLRVILLAKQVGFSLVDIQEVLNIYDKAEEIDDPAGVILKKFTGQLDVLKSQKAEIEMAIERLAETIRELKQD
ncbi:MAG: MerR family transcriptional regulator [Salaquimonas sp.]|jgi:DNA-binding transcriptional MerR regulator|nr:MerR family transcriptional regulator [Salaquimonas sp.]